MGGDRFPNQREPWDWGLWWAWFWNTRSLEATVRASGEGTRAQAVDREE